MHYDLLLGDRAMCKTILAGRTQRVSFQVLQSWFRFTVLRMDQEQSPGVYTVGRLFSMGLSCFYMSSSNGIGSLLLRLSFQGYFYIEQPWQIEIVSSLWSRRKLCFLYFIIKTVSPSGAKLGTFKVGQPIIKDWVIQLCWKPTVCVVSTWATLSPPWDWRRARGNDMNMNLMLLCVQNVMKSFVFGPGVSGLLPASMNLWQLTGYCVNRVKSQIFHSSGHTQKVQWVRKAGLRVKAVHPWLGFVSFKIMDECGPCYDLNVSVPPVHMSNSYPTR